MPRRGTTVATPGRTVKESLSPVAFGEFLVDNGALSRAQLYTALREQDNQPGIPLGEIVAYMGYLPYPEIDRLLTEWSVIPIVEVK